MDLEQAVAILNRERHEYDESYPSWSWSIHHDDYYVGNPLGDAVYTTFEAVAIAKEYERLRIEREYANCGTWTNGGLRVSQPLPEGEGNFQPLKVAADGRLVIDLSPRHDPTYDQP